MFHSKDIEATLLSSIIYNNSFLDKVIKELNAEVFYNNHHKEIYGLMIELAAQNMPIDETVLHKIISEKKPYLEDAFIQIIAATPIVNPLYYLNILLEDSNKRNLLELETVIKKSLITDKCTVSDVKKKLLEKLNKIDEKQDYLQEGRSVDDILDKVVQKHLDSLDKSKDELFKFGIASLDELIIGIEKKELVIIGGRPSCGKTAFACQMIINSIINSLDSFLFCTLEMTSEQAMERLLINVSDKTEDEHRLENFKNNEYSKALDFINTNKNRIEFYENYSNPTGSKLANHIRASLAKNKQIKNVVIDHLEEIGFDSKKREDMAIGDTVRELKNIAKEFNVRVFLLTQLNRDVEKRDIKRPRKSDIKNSGTVEEVADYVILLYNVNMYQEQQLRIVEEEIIVDKNRNGRTGTVRCTYDKALHKFYTPIVEKKKISLRKKNLKIKISDLKKVDI